MVDTFDDLDTDLAASLEQSKLGYGAMNREIDAAIAAHPATSPATPAPVPSPTPGPAPTPPSSNGGDH